MKWNYTDGWNLDDFSAHVESAVDYTLGADEKKPFVSCVFSAASAMNASSPRWTP